MSDSKGRWISDAHLRSEAEIADLAPYVPQAAIDAVRDALRKIVLENQDHSQVLDKLLPQLQQMPSKRSQALDWLDVELARLSDDAVIALMDRLKRVGGREVLLKRETQTVPRPQIRRRLWPTVTAAVAVCTVLSYGWASAAVSLRAEARENQSLRAQLEKDKARLVSRSDRVAQGNELVGRLIDAHRVLQKMERLLESGDLSKKESEFCLNEIERIKTNIERLGRSLADAIPPEDLAQQEQP